MSFKIKSRLAAVVTTTIWGVSFMFSKRALNHADVFVLLAWRFALAFLLMNVIRFAMRLRFDFKGKPVGKLILLGILQPVIYFTCENYGVKLSTATFSGIMIAMVPIASLIAGAVFLKERPTWQQAVFSVLSVAGVLLITIGPGSGLATTAGALFMIGAVISAAAYMMLSRSISGCFTPFERTYCMFALGSVFFILGALIEVRGSVSLLVQPLKSAEFLYAVLFLGSLSSVVAFFCQNFYITYLSMPESVVFSNLTTVVTIISGVLFLHDPFTILTIPAVLMIIAGIVGVQLSGHQKET